MDIDRLQKAIAIMNQTGKSGEVYAEHDELYLWPMADCFTDDEIDELNELGFVFDDDEGGFTCFT